MNTGKAALRFEGAKTLSSSVSNSVIHSGLGHGVSIYTSNHIEFKNNTIYDFKPIGIKVDFSSDITLDGNVVMRVLNTIEYTDGGYSDKAGAFYICTYYEYSQDACSLSTVVKNNIATGIEFVGFIT